MKHAARTLACIAVLGACAGCVLDSTPGIRDCQPAVLRYLLFGPSSGNLTIVPSVVAGVNVDSAGWMTNAGTYDIGAHQRLVLAVRLRWTRPIVPDTLALIYRGSAGMTPIVDDALGEPIFTTNDHPDLIDLSEDAETTRIRLEGIEQRRQAALADRAVRAEWREVYSDGIVTGFSMPFHGCPRSVQLVRKQELAAILFPERVRLLRAGLLQESQTTSSPPLTARVAWDSLIAAGGLGLFRTTIGFVVNPTDSLLSNARVAIVPEPRVLQYTDGGVPRAHAAPDTMWVPLGDLRPKSVVPFTGGGVEHYRRIIERRVFWGGSGPGRSPADSRQGRPIRAAR